MTDDTQAEPVDAPVEKCSSQRRRWWWGAGLGVALIIFYFLIGKRLLAEVIPHFPQHPGQALLSLVDVFRCCILSWKALTTMLPAFVLGGAIAAFAPASVILRYLGAHSKKIVAYPAAAISGMVLSLCSCNIVPLFVSIYRRGAGIGPAFTFLFAGPAINVVALIFTIQIIGWRLGVWRAIGVPLIAVVVGLCMAAIYRHEERRGQAEAPQVALATGEERHGHIFGLFGLLIAVVVYGAWDMPWTPKIIGMVILTGITAVFTWRQFSRDEVTTWWRETWSLIKLVIPVLIPAVLVIGALASYIDVKLVYHWLGSAPPGSSLWVQARPVLIGDVFGALMYFPILSEVAFTKAFLKLGMDIGPGLAILLTGAGLSLPGLLIIARAIGWRKTLAYQILVVVAVALFTFFFASQYGQYVCSCMLQK